MVNTIERSTDISKVQSVNKPAKNQDPVTSINKSAKTRTTDSLQVSQTLESIRSLSRAMAQGDPIDHARVDRIRSAINSGEYSVDSDRVARKFLELEKLLDK